MAYKIYKAKIWRHKIWITLTYGIFGLISGIFGLLMFLFGAAMTGIVIYQWLKGEVIFWVFLFVLVFSGLFLLTGGISFYIFLAGIKTKIIITDEFLIYDAPLYKERIFIQDIRGIAFKKTFSQMNLFYEKKGKIKRLDIGAGWHYCFPEIAEELKKVNPNIQMKVE